VRSKFALGLLLLLAAAAGSAQAAPKPSQREFVLVLRPDWKPCPSGVLPRVTVAEVATRPERFKGRCVRVRGVWAGSELYADLDAYHLRPNHFSPYREDPRAIAGRIGVYTPPDLVRQRAAAYETPVRADMVGRVGVCEDLVRRAELVSGYCREASGAILAVDDADLVSFRLARLVGERDRRDLGDLAPAPADWAYRARVESLLRDWLAAVAAGDRATLARLHGLGDELDGARGDDLARAIGIDDRTPGEIRGWRGQHQLAIFLAKPFGAEAADPARSRWDRAAVGCVCREADCTGRWPISWADAAANAARPYICLDLGLKAAGAGKDATPWLVSARVDGRRLVEPAK
jgi:hypothetical protein